MDVLETLQTLDASVQHHHCVESALLHRPLQCWPHCHVPVEVAGAVMGAGAGAGTSMVACTGAFYPESTDVMVGVRSIPELHQVVLRPTGGAVAILEGTRPSEMKAAGQSLEGTCSSDSSDP